MRVFVTGATGFIGSAIVHESPARGSSAATLRTSKACAVERLRPMASFIPPSSTTSPSSKRSVKSTGPPSRLSAPRWLAPAPGRLTTEDDAPNSPFPRVASEHAAAVQTQGVPVSVMRLPQVHDPVKQGLVTYPIAVVREKGVSAYVGDGRNRWPAIHGLDAARVCRLALEKGAAGARYNAVAEEAAQPHCLA